MGLYMAQAFNLNQLRTLKDYLSDGRTHVFPSETSLKWFIRKNKQKLLGTGAVLILAGRTLVDIDAFDKMVCQIGIESAKGENHV
jgi:hypothetical protein